MATDSELKLLFLQKHGIPHNPRCVIHDPVQGLIAIAGSEGEIQILGKAGVEATLQQPGSLPVTQVFFSVNEGILFSLCETDNSVTKWDLKTSPPEQKDRFLLTGEEITMVSVSKTNDKMIVAYLPVGGAWIYIGTEGGNLFLLHKDTLRLSEYCITYEKLSSRARGKWESPGFIIGVEECPANAALILILVSGGWINLWDLKSNSCETQFFPHNLDLVTIGASWHFSGKQFAAGYTDGSLSIWQLDNPKKPSLTHTPSNLYGVVDNASITRLFWLANPSSKDGLILFSGGPIGAESTLTVLYTQGSKQSSSSLIAPSVISDFVPLSFHPHRDKAQYPHAVALVCREELLVYEMMDFFAWRELPVPTANNLATSLVTAIDYIDDCPAELLETLSVLGQELCYNHSKEKFRWPLNGGVRGPGTDSSLLLTGHENGEIRFWDASNNQLVLIYYIKSTPFFKPPPPTRTLSVPEFPGASPPTRTLSVPEFPGASPPARPPAPSRKTSSSNVTAKLSSSLSPKSSPEAKYDVVKSVDRNIREGEWGSFVVLENREGERDRELAVSYVKLCPLTLVLCVANRSGYVLLHKLLNAVDNKPELIQLSLGEDNDNPNIVFNSKFQVRRGFSPHVIIHCRQCPTQVGFLPDCHMLFIQLVTSVDLFSLETNSLYGQLSLSQLTELKQSFFEDRNRRKGLLKTLKEFNDSLGVFVETLASEKITFFCERSSEDSKSHRFFLGTRSGHLVCVPAALDSSLNLSPSFSNPDLLSFDFWDATKRKFESGPVENILYFETAVTAGTGSQDRSVLEEFVAVVCPNLVRVSRVACLDRKKMKNSPTIKQFVKDKIKSTFLLSFKEGERPYYLACLLESGTFEVLGLPHLSTVKEDEKAFSSWISRDTFCLNENGKGVFLPTPSSIQRISVCREEVDSSVCLYNEREVPEMYTSSSFFHKGKSLTSSRGKVDQVLSSQSELYKHRQEQKIRTHEKAKIGTDAIGKAQESLNERGEKLNLVADRAANMSAMAEMYLQNSRALAEKYK